MTHLALPSTSWIRTKITRPPELPQDGERVCAVIAGYSPRPIFVIAWLGFDANGNKRWIIGSERGPRYMRLKTVTHWVYLPEFVA